MTDVNLDFINSAAFQALIKNEEMLERVAEILQQAGWRAIADAQWDGLAKALPELRAALAQTSDAECARLREALAPFAALLQDHNNFDERHVLRPDAQPVFGINEATITLGDLRKGRAVLEPRE